VFDARWAPLQEKLLQTEEEIIMFLSAVFTIAEAKPFLRKSVLKDEDIFYRNQNNRNLSIIICECDTSLLHRQSGPLLAALVSIP